ncbi:MAG TPA: rhodanese-like domain-containing protein [Rhizomicrobium sp.]|nr:rhodanese-like domain-containing protein [Rhizomicrobium sp.]
MAPSSSSPYAGDLGAADAWQKLQSEPKAQLIDVRTIAEWNFVGVPDLSPLSRRVHCIEWQNFPTGSLNPGFVAEAVRALETAGAGKDDTIVLMCRSGARSRAAAIALTAAGYEKAFNLAGGFEGDIDAEGHRGRTNGWKAAGLPWRQS